MMSASVIEKSCEPTCLIALAHEIRHSDCEGTFVHHDGVAETNETLIHIRIISHTLKGVSHLSVPEHALDVAGSINDPNTIDGVHRVSKVLISTSVLWLDKQ
jgi:hypothetical protein